jgi:O-antigen/teichoic acid export membrane protein
MKTNKFFKNGIILSLPGLLSIIVSLVAIPIHLRVAGAENYGNYIIFHFILTISLILNLGIGKSIVISIGNFPQKSKSIAYQGLKYTFVISSLVAFFFMFIDFINVEIFEYFFKSNKIFIYFIVCTVSTIFYVSLEGVLQGYEKYKSLSFYNFLFFSLSLTLPSLTLLYNSGANLDNLLLISTGLKVITVFLMLLLIAFNDLIKISNNNILINNLKKNSKWLTLNNILVQFYDIFDKYLVKILLGPVALATYSIPQQLTGKLTIFSKGFSVILLTILSKKKIDNKDLNQTIKIFLKIVPTFIFLIFPMYPILLNFWLGNEFNENILNLTKIFSLCGVFAGTSHILVTKFEASQSLKRNLKFEFILMPFFLLTLYIFLNNNYSLIYIASIILIKETILLFLRLNFLKKEIKNIIHFYLYSILFILMLYLSFKNEILFYLLEILLLISLFKNDK